MKSFSRHAFRFSFDYFISHYPTVFYVCVGVLGFLVFLALILAPLLIWRHVAKMRKGQKGLSLLVQALKEELEKVNVLAVEMQQRYLKTMQYVCDRLADICDGVNGIPSDSAPPPAPNLMPDSTLPPIPGDVPDSADKQPRNDVAAQG